MDLIIHPVRRIHGRFRVPPDHELAQRAAVLSLVCPGRCTIDNWPPVRLDAVLECLKQLGAQVAVEGVIVRIEGRPLKNLAPAEGTLACHDDAAAFVLLSGLLCGQQLPTVVSGEGIEIRGTIESMIGALDRMGAAIRHDGGPSVQLHFSPVPTHGTELTTSSVLPDVKMAVLIAGLLARGKTSVTEELPLPDDIERVLPAYGVIPEITYPQKRVPRREEILQGIPEEKDEGKFHKMVSVSGPIEQLRPVDWVLPGDFSLAAPLVTAAAVLPKSELLIEDVALNPTRTGLLKVLKRMGAEIMTSRRRMENGVPVGDISVAGSALKATRVPLAEVPSLVSELPLLTIIAGAASGVTVIRGIAELKNAGVLPVGLITENLRRMGVKVAELEDGWAIEGPTEWHAAEVNSGRNAAVGMAFAIAGLLTEKRTTIHGTECVASRFPDFQRLLHSLAEK